MIKTLRKNKGKSKPIKIDSYVRNKIASFKNHYISLLEDPFVTLEEKKAIYYILNELEPYELNILIAYYEFGNDAASMLDISYSVLSSNVKRILNKIQNKIK